MTFNDELNIFLKARYPVIYINTIEEDRVEYIIRKNVKINLKEVSIVGTLLMDTQIIQITKGLEVEILYKH
mgnify:CR=1 FL=1